MIELVIYVKFIAQFCRAEVVKYVQRHRVTGQGIQNTRMFGDELAKRMVKTVDVNPIN